MYSGWSKKFLEAGKKRITDASARAATSNEVNHRVSTNGYAGQWAWFSITFTTGLLGYQIVSYTMP